MDLINNLKLFNNLQIHPIPLEFNNSLTTTEWLLALHKAINNLVDEINKALKNYDNVHSEKVELLNTMLKSTNENVELLLNTNDYIENTLKPLISLINETIIELKLKDVDIIATVNNRYNRLLNVLEEHGVYTYSAITGKRVTLSHALREIYYFQLKNALLWNDVNLTWSVIGVEFETWEHIQKAKIIEEDKFLQSNFVCKGFSGISGSVRKSPCNFEDIKNNGLFDYDVITTGQQGQIKRIVSLINKKKCGYSVEFFGEIPNTVEENFITIRILKNGVAEKTSIVEQLGYEQRIIFNEKSVIELNVNDKLSFEIEIESAYNSTMPFNATCIIKPLYLIEENEENEESEG